MTGTVNMKPLVTGKAKSTRRFKGVQIRLAEYAYNANAWITASIFEDYLCSWETAK
jgi:hypothetical protein